MATGRSGRGMSASPRGKETSSPELKTDDLYKILRAQLRGRNEVQSQRGFHALLAEVVAESKIGEFYFGERLFARPEDPKLRALADQYDMIPEQAYRMTGGPVETMKKPCACADLTGLEIQGTHLSGSSLEGSDVRFNGSPFEWSDIDVMLQLGPVKIVDRNSARMLRQSSRRPPGVVATHVSVRQKGFFLLHHVPLPECSHPEPHPFSVHRIKKRLINTMKMTGFKVQKPGYEAITMQNYTFEGPSVASTDQATSADMVICISFPQWPSKEFASRRRRSQFPSGDLVQRLCQTPALLVPVGSPGSSTRLHEWRLSFSRHEFLVYKALPRVLKDCLVVLKHVNAVVHGSKAAIKGFQLKTSVLWLAERFSKDDLMKKSFHECLMLVLDFVNDSAQHGRLDCYFWTEINLLGRCSSEDLKKIAKAVDLIKKHLQTAVRVLVAVFVRYDDSGVHDSRLPSRNYERLFEFMFRRKLGQPKKEHELETWMNEENIGKLFSSRSHIKVLHDKVLLKLKSPDKLQKEQATRKANKAERWMDDAEKW